MYFQRTLSIATPILIASAFFATATASGLDTSFSTTLSKSSALADGKDSIQVSIVTKLKQKKLWLYTKDQGVILSPTGFKTSLAGKATSSVSSKTAGSIEILVLRAAPKPRQIQFPAGQIVGRVSAPFYAPLSVSAPDQVYQSRCFDIEISGGFGKITTRAITNYENVILSEPKYCVGDYVEGKVSIEVTDSTGSRITKSIDILRGLRFSGYLFLNQGTCTTLQAAGGAPRPEAPFYDFFQVQTDGSLTPLENQTICTDAQSQTATLEVRDIAGNIRRSEFRVAAPLSITTERFYKGCNGIEATGGVPLNSSNPYYFFKVLPDGSLQEIGTPENPNIICFDEIGLVVKVRVLDALGQTADREIPVFTPPPMKIFLESINTFELHHQDCAYFVVAGNLGMFLEKVEDPTGGYWAYQDYDSWDDRYSGAYCAGTKKGMIKLSFKDNDNAETFVLELVGLGSHPITLSADQVTIPRGECAQVYVSGGSQYFNWSLTPETSFEEITLETGGDYARVCSTTELQSPRFLKLTVIDNVTDETAVIDLEFRAE